MFSIVHATCWQQGSDPSKIDASSCEDKLKRQGLSLLRGSLLLMDEQPQRELASGHLLLKLSKAVKPVNNPLAELS